MAMPLKLSLATPCEGRHEYAAGTTPAAWDVSGYLLLAESDVARHDFLLTDPLLPTGGVCSTVENSGKADGPL